LTSRELFDLELSDLAFQRHILVQALILIHFLLSLTEQSKKKLATLDAVNKSMLYSFTLNEDDTNWALSTRHTIKQSLQSTADGRFYDRMVETVLARDKNWVRWKVESCPSIVRDAVTTEQELEARRGAKQHTRPRKIPEKPMGAMDWSFLVETDGGGLEALKDQSRFGAPSMDDLLKGIEVDKLDMDFAMSDAETARFTNMIENKSWRVVREARVHKLAMLDGFEPGKELKDVFKQPEKPEPAEDAVEECEESGPKPDEQAEAKDEAIMVDSEDKADVLVEQKDDADAKPVTTDNVDSTEAVKSPITVENPSTADDGEKMQTDESTAA
jgi:THO complex subunit 1